MHHNRDLFTCLTVAEFDAMVRVMLELPDFDSTKLGMWGNLKQYTFHVDIDRYTTSSLMRVVQFIYTNMATDITAWELLAEMLVLSKWQKSVAYLITID